MFKDKLHIVVQQSIQNSIQHNSSIFIIFIQILNFLNLLINQKRFMMFKADRMQISFMKSQKQEQQFRILTQLQSSTKVEFKKETHQIKRQQCIR
ncbi:unnamed protein product [Paramecium primaurelia]|uniref:Transmembrane protein n=1 Tax=Paramecium primaurelia TaxID=5886 RepID=A0A8S1LUF4_PARPR|nr:unnamed protein product [Paramecium primaurelia]